MPHTNPMPPKRPASVDLDDPRVLWAAERTLLAWIRTGLAMMGFGFLVARFSLFLREMALMRSPGDEPRPGLSLWIGTGLVLLGVIVNFMAAWQQIRIERQLFPTTPTRWPRAWLAVAVAIALGMIGLAMGGYLVALE